MHSRQVQDSVGQDLSSLEEMFECALAPFNTADFVYNQNLAFNLSALSRA